LLYHSNGVKVGNSGRLADVGLIIYGLVEISGATFSPNMSTIVNAVAVQVVVLAAWIYCDRSRGFFFRWFR